MNKSCEIYLVRHGETDWNAAGRIQGHTDIPLNTLGLGQAAQLGSSLAHIDFSAVYSSDLSRAKETARLIIGPRVLPFIETPALRERWAGSFEGQSKETLDHWTEKFFLSQEALSQDYCLKTSWHPEIESQASIFKRALTFLAEQLSTYCEQTILAVTHGGVIRAFLDHLSFIPKNKWIVPNCGFIKLKLTESALHLEEIHGIIRSHLP